MMLAEIDINPNVIIVFVAMIVAGFKALIEKRNQQNETTQAEDEGGYEELYEAYEAELAAQRQQLQIPTTAPAPLPTPIQVPAPQPREVELPTLSAAEQAALDQFNSRSNGPRKKLSPLSTKARVKDHLSSPTAAREALLLAEILGPPKALK